MRHNYKKQQIKEEINKLKPRFDYILKREN